MVNHGATLCEQADGYVFFAGASALASCSTPPGVAVATGPSVRLQGGLLSPVVGTHRRINGLDAYVAGTSGACAIPPCRTYEFPQLGVTISTVGPKGERAVATVTVSPRYRALHDGKPAPDRAWSTVRYNNVTLRAPERWPVLHIDDGQHSNPGICSGPTFDAPRVVLGYSNAGLPSCAVRAPGPKRGTNGVWISPNASSYTPMSLNRREATLLPSDPEDPVIVLGVLTHAAGPQIITVGVGADPAVARQIIASLSGDT